MAEAKTDRMHLELAPEGPAKWGIKVEVGLNRDQFTTLQRCLEIIMPELVREDGSPGNTGNPPPGALGHNKTRSECVDSILERMKQAEPIMESEGSRSTVSVTVDELYMLRDGVRFAHAYDKRRRLYRPDVPEVLPAIDAVWEGLGVATSALRNGLDVARQTFAQYSAGDAINRRLIAAPLS